MRTGTANMRVEAELADLRARRDAAPHGSPAWRVAQDAYRARAAATHEPAPMTQAQHDLHMRTLHGSYDLRAIGLEARGQGTDIVLFTWPDGCGYRRLTTDDAVERFYQEIDATP